MAGADAGLFGGDGARAPGVELEVFGAGEDDGVLVGAGAAVGGDERGEDGTQAGREVAGGAPREVAVVLLGELDDAAAAFAAYLRRADTIGRLSQLE